MGLTEKQCYENIQDILITVWKQIDSSHSMLRTIAGPKSIVCEPLLKVNPNKGWSRNIPLANNKFLFSQALKRKQNKPWNLSQYKYLPWSNFFIIIVLWLWMESKEEIQKLLLKP